MKLAINTLSIHEKTGGAKTYLLNIVEQLVLQMTDYEIIIFTSNSNRHLFNRFGINENVRLVHIPYDTRSGTKRIIVEQLILPFVLRSQKIDCLFAPRNTIPLLSTAKTVVVVHSMHLNLKYNVNEYPTIQRMLSLMLIYLSIRRSTRIIAISHYIKRTLCHDLTSRIESKTDVIYEGVDSPQYTQTNTSAVNVYSCYILFVGILAPHKNVDKLIRAFSNAVHHYGLQYTLVIVGRDFNNNRDQLEALVANLNLEDRVIFTGKVSDSTLTSLYRCASLFVFPSELEGFGLPVLEAMASSTPVIGGDAASIPEIMDYAGIAVDPHDTEALARWIYKVLSDDKLHADLVKKGHKRVQEFSWEATGSQTVGVIKKTLHQ